MRWILMGKLNHQARRHQLRNLYGTNNCQFLFYIPSPPGPTVSIPEVPKEIFQLFFTSELVTMISDETNKYAREVIAPRKSTKWTEVTVEEIYAYLGFNFLIVTEFPETDI